MLVNICQCGGHIHESRHAVSTLKGLHAWDASLAAGALPAVVVQRECHACGRYEKRLQCGGSRSAQASGLSPAAARAGRSG